MAKKRVKKKKPPTSGLRILGVDPAMRHLGLALMHYSPGVGTELLELKLVETKKENKKRGLRAKADDLRCLEIIRNEIGLIARTWAVDVVSFEECPSLRNSASVRQVALSWGLVWGLFTQRRGVLSFEYAPVDLKVLVTGCRTASKEDMIDALSDRYAGLLNADVPKSKKEHLADAIAAGLMATQEPAVIRLADSLMVLEES